MSKHTPGPWAARDGLSMESSSERLAGRQLRQRFKRGGADDILRTYLRLHERTGKIIGEHWMWCALERIAHGEPELQVMADYMYAYAGTQLPPSAEFSGAGSRPG